MSAAVHRWHEPRTKGDCSRCLALTGELGQPAEEQERDSWSVRSEALFPPLVDDDRPRWTSELQDSWGDFLSAVPWELWCTWTFDRRVGWSSARRAVLRWIGRVEDEVAERAPSDWAGIGHVLAAEKPRGHDWPHYHGLLTGVGPLYVRPHWQWWFRREGMGRFERVESCRGASLYCTKETYLAKDEGCEVDLSSNLGRYLAGVGASPVTLFPVAVRGRGHRAVRDREDGEGERGAGDVSTSLPGRWTWIEDGRGRWSLVDGTEGGARARVLRDVEGRYRVHVPGDWAFELAPLTSLREAREVAWSRLASRLTPAF